MSLPLTGEGGDEVENAKETFLCYKKYAPTLIRRIPVPYIVLVTRDKLVTVSYTILCENCNVF